MAGLGRKLFTRERATSADVQGYLMDQSVMVFASASARTTQVPSPSKGMVSFLSDVSRYDWHTGSAWVPMRPRLFGRSHTPVSSSIPAGGFRESGVGDGPGIPDFTVYAPTSVLVIGQFRCGTVDGSGVALPQLKVDGATISDGVSRTVDETTTIFGWASVGVGTHTVAQRVDALAGPVTWNSGKHVVLEAVGE